ncbi:Stk1 family PASTA domain-containing Ser/Thr kinase [Pseudonocardia sp. S2-4]|uniref:non-specific serine/threonine protein kinase n=2 Tax=Pseudonocardia humida TaxID=2800819 RepID=A0ABT0ZYP9_9PSEU|nr:Stk1 family PASTA domain-containing Ser/Thr kinase [Pseudonocardia humida]
MIARGGMSTVYRGLDTRLDRPVAIKIMDGRMAADPAFRTRFVREARSAARIDHPAVVDVFDQGNHHGPDGPALFLVMELVEGGTLRDVLRLRGALGVPAAVTVMDRVLAGLAEAHRLGLVHRDVKPENVLISTSGEVKVADFGLVVAAAEAGASHAGMIMGTVAYLSPEQVVTGRADARSDVYAAGILFYELLTGEPPYRGETAISVAYRHVNSDVPAPSDVAGDVPPEFDQLIQRATHRDPQGRPADAARLLHELRTLAEQLEVPRVAVPVPPAPPPEDVDTAPRQRHPDAPGEATRPNPVVPGGRPGAGAAPAGPRGTRALPRPVEEAPAAAAAEPPPHLRARRRSRRVFAAWLMVVLVLAAAIGVSAWWLGSGRWTAVPSLVGVEETVAQRLLEDADLVAVTVEKPDDGVAEGLVAAADRPPDSDVLRGSTVTITVSTGKPRVPTIAPGTTVAEAEALIRDAGLEPRSSGATEYSDSAPEGTVTRSQPSGGSRVDSGSAVELVLSRGERPEQVRVPFVTGRSYAEAEARLQEVGLEAEERPRIGGVFGGGGLVVGQDQGAGSMVEIGTTVVLDTLPF